MTYPVQQMPLVPEGYRPSDPREQRREPQYDITRPSGVDAQGNALASVHTIMDKVGGGDPVVTIARLNEYAVKLSDELQALRALAPQIQQLEEEHQQMVDLLSDINRLAPYYDRLDFEMGVTKDAMPWIAEFRTNYPNATYEEFVQWKRQLFNQVTQEAPAPAQVDNFVPAYNDQKFVVDNQQQFDMPGELIGLRPQQQQPEDRSPLPPMTSMQVPQNVGGRANLGDDFMAQYYQAPQTAYRQLDQHHLGQYIFAE